VRSRPAGPGRTGPGIPAPRGAYVHIPFCRRKCPYCAFLSVAGGSAAALDRYVATLCAEVRARGDGRPVSSVYFGGGTPSLAGARRLGRVLAGLGKGFHVERDAEVTVECNPESASPFLFRGLKAAGVNRISIGVQSLDDTLLRRLGRLHDARRAVRAVVEARAAGFANVSVDMMFGLPGQSVGAWKEDLRRVVALPVAHVSCYELHLEAGTPLAVASLPGEDEVADMWEAAFDELGRAGFVHYEVANHARPGRECRHNLGYWSDREWFGFGAGAWSSLKGVRTANASGIGQYQAARKDGFPPAETDAPPDGVRAAMALIMALRLRAGADLEALREKYGGAVFLPVEPAVERHVAGGLLEREGGRLRLSRRGLLLANVVWADLLEAAEKGFKSRVGAPFPAGFLSTAAAG